MLETQILELNLFNNGGVVIGKIKDNRLKNIYKEAEGVYRIEISNGFRDDGTRDRIVERVYGTEDEAITRRDQMKALQKKKKEEGLKEQNSGYTLTQLAERYLNDSKYKKRSPTTLQGYRNILNSWILPELGEHKIRNIEESDLENLYAKMKKSKNNQTGKPLSDTYITHVHKLIKSMYNYAKKKKWILSNPADYVLDAPNYSTLERDYYGYDEMLKVFELLEFSNQRFKTAIYLLFNTGLRRGELAGLKWKDLKIKSSPKIVNGKRILKKRFYLSVRREITRVADVNINEEDIIERLSKGLICKDLKTDKSKRDITVIMDCYDWLMKYKEEQIKSGFNPTENDYIFRTFECDRVWDPNYLTKEWNEFLIKKKLKKITIHDIRHSHATYLLSIGVPLQDVSRRLGHSEPATTLKIYTHSSLAQDEKITDYMEIAMSVGDHKSEYAKFIQNAEQDVKDNLLSVYSIITGISLTSMDNIYNALDKFMGEPVDNDTLPKAIGIVRSYLFETNPKLKNIASMIQALPKSDINTLVDMIIDISNGYFFDMNPIDDLKIHDYSVSI